jgi:integrase
VAQNVALAAKRIDAVARGSSEITEGVDYPAPEEIKAFTAVLPAGRWWVLFLVAAFTGLRGSELRGLAWPSVDLKAGEIRVRQRADYRNVIGPPKSKAGSRTVPLGPRVLNALREWKLQCPRGDLGLVFPTGTGKVNTHAKIVKAFQSHQRRAGIVVDGKAKYTGLHALRHFYASWCINPVDRGGQGLPPKVVQKQLGHASIVMTMDRYGHLFPAGEDANKKLAEAERVLLG